MRLPLAPAAVKGDAVAQGRVLCWMDKSLANELTTESPPPQKDESGPLSGLDRLRIYVAIPLTLLLFNMAFFLPRNLLSNYMERHHLGQWSGWVLAVLPLTVLLLAIPMGLLSDRFSPRRLVMVGLVFLVAFTGIFFFRTSEPTLPMLFGSFLLGGIAIAIADASLRPLYLKCIGHRGQALKLALLSVVTMLGFGGSTFLGGLAAKHLDWSLDEQYRLAFPLALAGLLMSLAMKDAEPMPFDLSAYRASILRRKVLVYLFLVFCNALHFGVEAVCIPPYITNHLGKGDADVGNYFGVICLVMAVTAALSALIRDHSANRHRMWVWGLLFSATFNIISVLYPTLWWFFSFRIGHVVADAIMLNAGLRIVASMFPRKRVAGPMGLAAMVVTAGVLVGNLVSNGIRNADFIPTAWQLPAPFLLAGLVVYVGLVIQRILGERF